MTNTDDLDLLPHQRPHHVYRVYDANDVLLYIGCTRELGARMAVHHSWGARSEASLYVNLYGIRVESEEHPDRKTALAAERAAIEAEAPALNQQSNPKRFRRTSSGYQLIGESYQPPAHEVDQSLADLLNGVSS